MYIAKHRLRPKDRFCTHASIIFFGPELGLYQLRSPPQRSILEHVSICSPSSDPHRLLFFGPEPERNSTSGITHGRKPVSPSRNPCNSDPFLVATHNRCSPSSDPHRLIFELFFSGQSWDYINFARLYNAQFLSTYRSVRLRRTHTD